MSNLTLLTAPRADEAIVSTLELQDWLGLSGQAIADLANRGVISRSARGRWPLRATVFAVAAHYREIAAGRGGDAEGAALASARSRLATAQAEAIERKNSFERNELVSVTEMATLVTENMRMVVTRLMSIPAEHAPELHACPSALDLQNMLRGFIAEALERLQKAFGERQRGNGVAQPQE